MLSPWLLLASFAVLLCCRACREQTHFKALSNGQLCLHMHSHQLPSAWPEALCVASSPPACSTAQQTAARRGQGSAELRCMLPSQSKTPAKFHCCFLVYVQQPGRHRLASATSTRGMRGAGSAGCPAEQQPEQPCPATRFKQHNAVHVLHITDSATTIASSHLRLQQRKQRRAWSRVCWLPC